MKLELKHLAAYLPYGLKILVPEDIKGIDTGFFDIEWDNDNCISSGVYEVTGINYENSFLPDCVMFRNGYLQIENCKPILRPLSDLTEEIEVGGERFVPNLHPYFKYLIHCELDIFLRDIPYSLDYRQYSKLTEWHFDIYGLIEQGLAIDINTLKVNP